MNKNFEKALKSAQSLGKEGLELGKKAASAGRERFSEIEQFEVTGTVEYGASLKAGLDVFTANPILLLGTFLITALLGGVSFGILLFPMWCGFFSIVERLRANDPVKPVIGDVFKGFRVFGRVLGFCLLLLLAVIVYVSICAYFDLSFIFVLPILALWLFCVPLIWTGMISIMNRDTSAVGTAVSLFRALRHGAFWKFLVFGIVCQLIGYSGVILFGLGVFVTGPIGLAMFVCGYASVFGGRQSQAD